MKWRLTIDTTGARISAGAAPNVWVVEGDGPLPVLVDLTPPDPPVNPVGDPYAPQPGEDASPYVFPTNIIPAGQDSDRSYPLSMTAPGKDYYANEAAGNPVGLSHRHAGFIAAGGQTDYGRRVGGMLLWVRFVAGEDPLTGKPLPPAPGYLIRRALHQGHL